MSRPQSFPDSPAARRSDKPLDASNLAIFCLSICLPFVALLPTTGGAGVVRATGVTVFLLLFPGLTLIRLLHIDQPPWNIGLVVATSVGIGVTVSVAWAYVGNGTWEPPFVVLAALAVGFSGWRLRRDRRQVAP